MLPWSSRHTSCHLMKGGTNVVVHSYGIDDTNVVGNGHGIDDTNVVVNVSDKTSDDPDYVNSTKYCSPSQSHHHHHCEGWDKCRW